MDEWLSSAAGTWPDHPAVEADAGILTYAELDAEATTAARRLVALGVAPGDRVATTLTPGLEFAALLHALPRIGAALVPLNTRLPADGQRRQRELAGARLVIESPLLDGFEADVPAARDMDPDAVHTVLFTSGTSGEPKPVELTVGKPRGRGRGLGRDSGPRPRRPLAGPAAALSRRRAGDPHPHRAGRGHGGAGQALRVGIGPRRPRGGRVHPGVGGGHAGPAPARRRARACARPARAGAGRRPRAARPARLGPRPPDPGPQHLRHDRDHVPGRGHRALGEAAAPLPGVELAIAPDEEILVRGPMVAPGALRPDGWLHTGDVGRIGRDGRLKVQGRLTDLIISGGENVAPAAVEATLLAHPAVADAGVAGVPDEQWGKR
ncbi:MAG: class I adenylate-forming enzyme family protein [Thermoleophilaceae bacterium]